MYFLDEIWVYDFYDSIYLTFSLKPKKKTKQKTKKKRKEKKKQVEKGLLASWLKQGVNILSIKD